MTRATEPALRTMLRLSLEGAETARDLPLRKGRRLVWVSEALAPLADTLDPAKLEALTLAIAATCGIEVHVWLTDVAGLDPDGAADVMRWIADLILAGAVDEDAPDPPSSGAAMHVVRSRLGAPAQVHGRAARSSQRTGVRPRARPSGRDPGRPPARPWRRRWTEPDRPSPLH